MYFLCGNLPHFYNSSVQLTRFNIGESRPLHWFKEVGGNAKEFGRDTVQTYLKQPLQNRNVVQTIMGPVGVALNTILMAPDAVLAGVADKKLEAPSGPRLGRDLTAFGKDFFTLHWIHAGLDLLRMPGSFAMDAFDAVGRFRDGTRGNIKNIINP